MTLPCTAAEVLSGHVTLEVRCIDRVLVTVRQPRLQYGQGIHGFFCGHRGNQFVSSTLMMPMTERFAADIRHYIDTGGWTWSDSPRGRVALWRLRKAGRVEARRAGSAGPVRLPGLRGADPLVLPGPFAVPQHELLHLAGGGLGQRPELDRVRALVVGEPLPAERDDLLPGGRGALVEGDERLGPLTPVLVRDADHRALQHRGMGRDGLLDLDAGDVLPAGDD